MSVPQNIFRDALLDAERPVPDGLQNGKGDPAGARFSVYRNNVIVSLTDALATAFPLVRKLLGAETFGKLAAVFVRTYPPGSPLMMFYGEKLPDFLDSFEPLMHIKYLSTCAQLDIAMRQSYHAADATPPDVTALQDPERAMHARFSLAPSARIIRSAWPLYDIWAFNMKPSAPKPRAIAQDVLVARPGYDPQPHLLSVGMADWLDSLDRGHRLGHATEDTLETHQNFDLAGALTLALNSQALVDYTAKEIP